MDIEEEIAKQRPLHQRTAKVRTDSGEGARRFVCLSFYECSNGNHLLLRIPEEQICYSIE